jgi:hypothetical protein
MWLLSFSTTEDDKSAKGKAKVPEWNVTLSLLEDSPPTPISAQLLIHDAFSQQQPASAKKKRRVQKHSLRPDIAIVLKTPHELIPSGPKIKARSGQRKEVTATIEEAVWMANICRT